MKKRVWGLLLTLVMILSLMPGVAFAEDNPYIKTGSCGENATWTLDISKRELKISGTGKMIDYSYGSSAPWNQYKSYIETVIVEEGMTSIGSYAFYDGGATLTSVQLPDTLTSIGSHAFYSNSSLETINLPDSVCQIGTYAFAFCDALTSIAIPSGVKTIETGVFDLCGASLYQIPSSVEKIENKAFYGVKGELLFYGKMPEFVETPFINANATILYPCANTTWDPVFFSDFGGTLTWEKNHATMDFTTAVTDAENKTVTGRCPTCRQNYMLSVDQISCKDSTFFVSVSTRTEQNYSVICTDGCQLTYAKTGAAIISAGTYYSGTYTYGIRIPDLGIHTLKISGSAGGNDLYYTVFVRDHSYSSSAVAPTCTESGYTTHVCAFCGDSYEDTYVNALGHNAVTDKAVAATCTTAGKTEGSHCGVCNAEIKAQDIIPAMGHFYTVTDTAPTYTTQGYTTHTCTVCGYSYKDNYTDKLIPTAPAAPALSISKADGKINLGWNAVNGATKYWIYRSTDGTNFKYYDSTTKTSYTNSSVTSGTKYYYKVKAVATINGTDYASAYSNAKSTIPMTTPVIKASLSAGAAKLSWGEVTGATKYWIYRSTDGTNFSYYDSTTKTSYTNSSVTAGNTYYYKVRAVKNVNGTDWTSDYSTAGSVKVLKAPTVSISKANGRITISWNAVDGAVKYWIYRSTDGTNFKYYDTTTKTSYTNSSVTSGTKYYYKVKAVNSADGTSTYSAVKSTIPLTTPTLSATLSSGKIKLSWGSVTGATKYWIYRSTDGKNFSYYDSTTNTSYTNSSVTAGKTYYYKIRAVKTVNSTDWTGSYSNVVSKTR